MKRLLIVFGMTATLVVPLSSYAATCASVTTLGGSISYHVGDFNTSPGRQRAALFTPTSDCTVSDVQVNMKKDGSPSGNVSVALYSVASGVPSSSLESGSTITAFTTSFGWQTSTFSGATTLTGGTTYAIVAAMTSGWDDTNWYDWNSDGSGGSGGADICSKSPGGSWSCGGATDQLNYIVEGTVPTPPATTTLATSTPDQAEQNLANAVYIFLASFFGMVWLMRKH